MFSYIIPIWLEIGPPGMKYNLEIILWVSIKKMLDQLTVHKVVPGCFVQVPKTVRFIWEIWKLNLGHDLFGKKLRVLIHNKHFGFWMDNTFELLLEPFPLPLLEKHLPTTE